MAEITRLHDPEQTAARNGTAGFHLWRSLPSKLLLFTGIFVMLVQILIFLPSIANFRKDWLLQRVITAKVASLAVEVSGGAALPERLRQELLMSAGVHAVSLRRPHLRKLVLGMPENEIVSGFYDLRSPSPWELTRDSLAALAASGDRLVRVVGAPDMMPEDEIDIVIDETPLRAALWTYASNLFWISLLIAVSTAALVYIALNTLFVRPMMRLTRSIVEYRENPEDASRIVAHSDRSDEIGVAERELRALQTELTAFLREKSRLATIGLAVSKINHDLRNMLSSAQLVSDRLAAIDDPTVQRFMPRLIRALDRAIGLCVDILKYGRTEQIVPERTVFALDSLVEDVFESIGADNLDTVCFSADVTPALRVWADQDHLHRVLTNILRNALDALKAHDDGDLGKHVHLDARLDGSTVVIRVSDNGPGLPAHVREHIFKPFHSSRQNGTGLGLAIAAELVHAHGGLLRLDDNATGATFIIELPSVIELPGVRDRPLAINGHDAEGRRHVKPSTARNHNA